MVLCCIFGKNVIRRNLVHLKPNHATTTSLSDHAILAEEPPATSSNRSKIGSICDEPDAEHHF